MDVYAERFYFVFALRQFEQMFPLSWQQLLKCNTFNMLMHDVTRASNMTFFFFFITITSSAILLEQVLLFLGLFFSFHLLFPKWWLWLRHEHRKKGRSWRGEWVREGDRKTTGGGGRGRQKIKKDKVMRERGVEGEKWWLGEERVGVSLPVCFSLGFVSKSNLMLRGRQERKTEAIQGG